MNDRDQRRYNRLKAVQTFRQNHAADFAAGSLAAHHFGQIDACIGQLDAARAGQLPARASKATLLDALTLDLRNIGRTARAIEDATPPSPGFAAPYRFPDNKAASSIAAHADAVLAHLEDTADDTAEQKTARAALRARFVAYELPAEFVAELRADRDALEATGENNEAATQGGVENTALISQLLTRAGATVDQLDTIMGNKYTRAPEKLHAWSRASRVERTPKHNNGKPANGASPTPPPPAPPS